MLMIHVIYAPGSNIENLYWVWHCTAMSIDEALKTPKLSSVFSSMPYIAPRVKLHRLLIVQQRQWGQQHEHSHYATCLFQYERKYAVLMRPYSIITCIDEKHRVKIGEPDAPVASAERGRQVIVHSGRQL